MCPSFVQGDLGLNICEAHAFNTSDRFSLDIFVVDGWGGEGGAGKESLEQALSNRFAEVAPAAQPSGGDRPADGQAERRLSHHVRTARCCDRFALLCCFLVLLLRCVYRLRICNRRSGTQKKLAREASQAMHRCRAVATRGCRSRAAAGTC